MVVYVINYNPREEAEMKLWGGIDLHSNNSYVVLLNEKDGIVYEKRLPNDLEYIRLQLSPYQDLVEGIAIESTYNWYWLVDGLMGSGYRVHLVNTAAVQQYEGMKYTSDSHDARWLAHLLRLEILPTGYIYPKEERAVRDLLRKRSQLVRHRVAHMLSIQNLVARNSAVTMSANEIKKLCENDLDELFGQENLSLAAKANLAVLRCLDEQIEHLEKTVLKQTRLKPEFQMLLTVPGIGKILALTIMLETGDIRRFARVGQFASYGRCVETKRLSNGKKKGEGNAKCGNKYLAWAFIEAANFAIRYNERVKRCYQRKKAKSNGVVAIKATAHKLARACYHVMRERVAFNIEKAFA